jgi:hypothetical protein
MSRPCRVHAAALAAATLAAILAMPAAAQDRQVYRYVDPDGKVVYSDRPPPSEAKGVQQKRLGGNFIETTEPSYATRVASERFPVTLFTFACGEPCQNAEAMLNARGVPFTKVNVEDPPNAKKLQQLTGEVSAPVMQVGDKLIAKGWNEARWQQMLDQAGYPKAPPRRTAARPAQPPAQPAAAAAPAAADDDAEEGPAPGTNVTTLPAPAGGYPR